MTTSIIDYENISRLISDYKETNFDRVNVFGVITFIGNTKRPASTFRNDCTPITIVDKSCSKEQRLKTIVFSNVDDEHTIANSCQVGDIIRFHRFKIQPFNNNPQGCANAMFCSWVRFKKDANDYQFVGNKNTKVTEQDEDIVKSLREWLRTRPDQDALIEAGLGDCATTSSSAFTAIMPSVGGTKRRSSGRTSIETASALMNSPNDLTLNVANLAGNDEISQLARKLLSLDLRLIRFDTLKPESYFDMLCQVLVKCEFNGSRFIMVWDATNTNLAVLQETKFMLENNYVREMSGSEDFLSCDYESSNESTQLNLRLEKTATNNSMFNHDKENTTIPISSSTILMSNAPRDQTVYYSKSISELVYQVFVYDDYVAQLEQLEPGDFIILKNANSKRPTNSMADTVIKMPGGMSGKQYKREIIKIGSADFDSAELKKFNSSILNLIDSRVQAIKEAGKRANLAFISEQKFHEQFNKVTFDDSIESMILKDVNKNLEAGGQISSLVVSVKQLSNNNTNSANENKNYKKSYAERLMEDELSKYISEDEEDEEEEDDDNKTTTPKRKPIKKNVSRSDCHQKQCHQSPTTRRLNKSFESNMRLDSPKKRKNLLNELNSKNNDNNVTITTVELPVMDCRVVLDRIDVSLANEFTISSDIYELKRLTNLTYLMPIVNASTARVDQRLFEQHHLFFDSIEQLKKTAETARYLKCKVIAKLFNYSISSCPPIASMFVNCKKCNYVNFTPFHLASIHQTPQLTLMLNDLNKMQHRESADEEMECDSEKDEQKCCVNFSLDWLKTALPIDMQERATQQTQSSPSSSIPIMIYECPRCSMRQRKLVQNNSRDEDEQQPLATTLDYIYRFWFVLRDQHDKLEPCLIESDVALKFVNNVPPSKFYCADLAKKRNNLSHQVYQTINNSFNKKYLFTIEAFDIRDKFDKSNSKEKNINTLFKIVDMLEITAKPLSSI